VQLVSRVNWPLNEVVRETSPGVRVMCEHTGRYSLVAVLRVMLSVSQSFPAKYASGFYRDFIFTHYFGLVI